MRTPDHINGIINDTFGSNGSGTSRLLGLNHAQRSCSVFPMYVIVAYELCAINTQVYIL